MGREWDGVGWVGEIAVLDWRTFFRRENRQHEQLSLYVRIGV